jgi:hypothetical protein
MLAVRTPGAPQSSRYGAGCDSAFPLTGQGRLLQSRSISGLQPPCLRFAAAVTGHHARLGTRLLARLCRGRHLRRLSSTHLQGATRTDPGVRLSRTGLLPKVERDRGSWLWRPMHPKSAGSQLRLHAASGTESGACVAARLPFGRPPSLHHLRHRFVVGFVRGFTGTMQPSDSSPLPRRLRLLGFPSRPRSAIAVWAR